jgi:ribose transport system permease protein
MSVEERQGMTAEVRAVAGRRPRRKAGGWQQLLDVSYPLLAILALIATFTIASPRFLTVSNALNIGRQSGVLLLVALAGTLVILIGSIDLSVGGIVTLSGVVCALLLDGRGPLVACLAAVAVGAAVGLANGSLLLLLRIPSFLVTLGMLSVASGLAAFLSDNAPVPFANTSLADLINGTAVLGIPNVILLTLAVLILLTVVAFRTTFGRYLYAIGGGEQVAAASGVPVARYKLAAFVLSGVLCGLAGVVITGQVGTGTLDVGANLLLDSVAAAVMGGTALSGGVGGPHRTLLGVLVIAILSNGMDVVGATDYVQDLVKGGVIIAAVALSIDRKKYSFIK